MENPLRGDVAVVIDGKRYVLRLTLGALAALEARLESQSLMELAERFETGQISATDLTALLAAGLMGGGHDLTEADLAKAEIEGGAVGALHAGMALLARAFQPLGDG
ncbi:MAG: gene transfer agent family protein [Pseudomonadota bacterium]